MQIDTDFGFLVGINEKFEDLQEIFAKFQTSIPKKYPRKIYKTKTIWNWIGNKLRKL